MTLLATLLDSPAPIPIRFRHAMGAFLLLTTTIGQAQTPTVTILSSPRNARSAPRTNDVGVGFSQTLSNTIATQQILNVFNQQAGSKKAGRATVSGNTLSFNPTTDFKPGETVSATVTSAAQSTSGTTTTQHVFQFTTAVSPSSYSFAKRTPRTPPSPRPLANNKNGGRTRPPFCIGRVRRSEGLADNREAQVFYFAVANQAADVHAAGELLGR
ncbi:Ig-like domain-containing protein [Hymenobacter sp. GOD-10R]|uniref:Ig-like domain-containing protein n=1 Tax=Hymenobacter sp. GOD-10R TaxID=3093922 RepID=UPI002D79BAB4|nr:Ig-like domain-containing protein [Hymenobacter sp. GOD-10R]WRQ30847.1 Ig-like domain-containing protein [Hymenobacter sp. GOD-10R]